MGYSITNESTTDWLLTINLNSDAFLDGTANSLFDFPEVAPGTTVTDAFDPINSIGLYELTWDPDAPTGFTNSGNFVLSAQREHYSVFTEARNVACNYRSAFFCDVCRPMPSAGLRNRQFSFGLRCSSAYKLCVTLIRKALSRH